jgi:alkaline phosphatase D
MDGSAVAKASGSGLGLVDDLNYSDSNRRGYLLMTVSADAVKGEFVFVSTVKSATYTAAVGKTITVTVAGVTTYA